MYRFALNFAYFCNSGSDNENIPWVIHISIFWH